MRSAAASKIAPASRRAVRGGGVVLSASMGILDGVKAKDIDGKEVDLGAKYGKVSAAMQGHAQRLVLRQRGSLDWHKKPAWIFLLCHTICDSEL